MQQQETKELIVLEQQEPKERNACPILLRFTYSPATMQLKFFCFYPQDDF